ncbi:RHS repeat domain-containing protein [Flavobacterium sp.]|uniref:RHS repeat domain-containing protein n=1 Tax=Flavobacterium sp. TaxID=239 RepID=UPI0037BF5708
MINFLSFSQNNNSISDLEKIIPKTPEASALSKFIDIAPGNYTGSTSVTVPIYTINSMGISLPISIDYHASGITVGQVSSRSGLGWIINVGNISLSKQIIGTEDLNNIPEYNVIGFNPDALNVSDNDYSTAFFATGIGGVPIRDTQPDIFSFSINGMSGKFVKDSQGVNHMIPYNNIKISRTSEFPYILTNTAGIQYKFKVDNIQLTVGGSGSQYNGETNFRIAEIENLNGEKIVFNYRNVNYQYMLNRAHTENIDVEQTESCGNVYGLNEFSLSYAQNNDGILTEIIFPNGKVIFKYSDEKPTPEKREDIVNDVYCYGIQVQNSSQTLIKNFQLNQSYFVSSGYDPDPLKPEYMFILEPMRKALYYRLKLNSVQELLSNTKYTFEYDEEQLMPNRFSFDTDYWGFYNGANNACDLPRTLYNNRFYGEANKEPNFAFGKTLTLKKVTFPTGGNQIIEYENDDFYTNVTEVYNPYQFEINTLNGNSFFQNYPILLTGNVDQRIEFFSNPNVLTFAPEGSLPQEGETYVYGVVLDQNFNELKRIYLNGEVKVEIPHNQTCYLKLIKVGADPIEGSLKLKWYTNNSITAPTNKKVGTLRVKKITLNPVGGKTISRTFEYKNPATNFSSGINHGDELIPYVRIRQMGNGNSHGNYCNTTCDVWQLSSNSGIDLNSVNGKSIGYDFVSEVYNDEMNIINNYSILSEFSNNGDNNVQYVRYSPIVPRESNSFARGFLLKKKHFDKFNTIKKVEINQFELDYYFNQFSSDNYNLTSVINALKIDWIDFCTSVGWGADRYFFDWKAYEIPSAWIKQTKKETTDYFATGNVTTTEDYFYNSSHTHTFPIKVTTSTSNTIPSEKIFKYPPDYSSGDPIVDELIARNSIETPLNTKTSKNDAKLSEQTTVYDKSTATSNLLLPRYIYANKGLAIIDITLDKKITYDKYDNKGNLQQYTPDSGVPVSIIWGYSQTLPIAKIENATNAQIATALGIANLNTLNETNLPAINNLRTSTDVNLQKAMITTYTHIPLIGVSTITDPKGDKITYTYDAANRLQNVKDKNDNILSENEYHYKP